MADVVFVALTIAFFALGALYATELDRLVRSAEGADQPEEVTL